MYCKNCGKQSTSEICDECVAKLARENAAKTENAENAENTAEATEKPAITPYYAANYGKKGAILSFVCGIVGFILSYVAVFFGSFYRQAIIEMGKVSGVSQKEAIEEIVNIGKTGFTISIVVCAVLAALSLIYGIISIVRFIKTSKKGVKPVKTLVFGIIGCALTVTTLMICMMALGYFNGQIPLPTV